MSTTATKSPYTGLSQRDLVLASIRRGTGKENAAGHKHGQGCSK